MQCGHIYMYSQDLVSREAPLCQGDRFLCSGHDPGEPQAAQEHTMYGPGLMLQLSCALNKEPSWSAKAGCRGN